MALPKVQKNDIVEIAFKNHDQIHVCRNGDLHLSKKTNQYSCINWDDLVNIFAGGSARVIKSDKASITIEFTEDNDAVRSTSGEDLRVERTFIKSLKVLRRCKIVTFGQWHLHVPEDPKEEVELFDSDDYCNEDSFSPKAIKEFLKQIKKTYFKKKKKKKKKKKTKAANKKGAKVSRENHKYGMKVDVKAVAWNDADDDLNSTELLLAFKGSFSSANIYFDSNGLHVSDPSTGGHAPVRSKLVKSMTLSEDYVHAEDPDDDSHPEFGSSIEYGTVSHHTMEFFEKGVSIGCQDFDLKEVKVLYKALCKVYGEPK